jgi:G6PDH family F420-dependent oxidoreductase
MTTYGYFLSCEEFTPAELVEQAKLAERAGFEALWISDHFHPWNDEQGQSAFVWSVIGALSQVTSLPITTAVTCPTIRIHPAIIAHAAATSSMLLNGRFVLGVGSGEALNEHILGDAWPSADERLAMLEEAIQVIRLLHEGGVKDFRGEYYAVENARIYTLPEQPVPIYISGFGSKSATLAGRIGDGFCCTKPDAELVGTFRDSGGGRKPVQGGFKVCYGPDAGALRAGQPARDAGHDRAVRGLRPGRRPARGERPPVRAGRLRRGLRPADRPRPGAVLPVLARGGPAEAAVTPRPAAAPYVGGMRQAYVHQARLEPSEGGDRQAPGAAVTVALCGHWEHEPPCRVPHHTAVMGSDGGGLLVRVPAPWRVLDQGRSRLTPQEQPLADRLAGSPQV